MKKTLKIISFVILALVLVLILIPTLFKKTIETKVNEEIAKNLNLKVAYNDLDISLLKHFPNLSVELEHITVSGVDFFQKDTLFVSEKADISINLWNLISNGKISVNSININHGLINGIINKSGKQNWDVVKQSSETIQKDAKTENEKTDEALDISIDKIKIEDVTLAYNNKLDSQLFKVSVDNLILRAELSKNNKIELDINGQLKDVFIKMGANTLIEKLPVDCQTSILGDLNKMKFDIKNGKFNVKGIPMELSGNFEMQEENYLVDMIAKTEESNIKTLTSLIPASYQKDLKGIETKGLFSFQASAKGKYTKSEYPVVLANVSIADGFVKFPQKEAIDKINLKASLQNYGKGFQQFKINMPDASLNLANNPVKATLFADNITTSPQVKGTIKSNINLGELEKVFPLKDMTIKGLLDADITFDGNLNDIEKENYEKFKTSGYAKLTNFIFASKSFSKDIAVNYAGIDFKTEYVQLNESRINIGNTQLSLKGKINNYIQYITKGKTLHGNFTLNSSLVNVADFTTVSDNKTTTDTIKNTENQNSGILEVPTNLDLSLVCKVHKLIYQTTELSNIKGNMKVADGKINLSNLNFLMADGTVNLNGIYTPNQSNKLLPTISFNTKLNSLNLQKLIAQVPALRTTLPIGTETKGKVSTELSLTSQLDKTMSPLRKTGNGKGNIIVQDLIISNNNMTKNLVTLTGNNELSRIRTSNLNIDYTMSNGDIKVAPFNTSIAGRKTTGEGTLFADNELDFSVKLEMTSKDLNGNIGKQIKKIPGMGDIKSFPVALKITGNTDKPIVTPDIKNIASHLLKKAKGNIFNSFAKKLFGGSKDKNSEDKK